MSQPPKKAFALLRVSGEGQTKRAGAPQGYSVEFQRETCQREAVNRDAEIVQEWIAPAESASRGFYKTLTEMIAALKVRGDIDYVIIYKLERFARDELTDFAAYAEIKKAGAELVSATENIDGTPQGMLLHGVLASINAYYSRDLAGKITDGRRTKAKLGGTPNRAPLGYLNKQRWEGKNDIRYVEIDPDRWRLILWAFQAYATGEWSLKALADELYRRGLRTRPTPKRPAGIVKATRLHRILQNRYYIGVVEFQGVEYEGSHPQFVPEELFEEAQQVLTAHRLAGDRTRKNPGNYLVGTVYCGLCGQRLMYTKCTGRHGKKFDYLICTGRHQDKSCDLPYLPVGRVEEFVTAYYEGQIASDAEQVAAQASRLVQQAERVFGLRQRQIVRCQKKLDDLRAKRTLLVESHLANPDAVPLDVLAAKQVDLDREMKAAEEELSHAQGNLGNAKKGRALAEELLADSAGSYRHLDPLTKRRCNQSFFSKVFVGPGGVKGSEPTDEYAILLREDLAERLEEMAARPRLSFGRGSTETLLVELRGLEPLTFALPARRSSS